MLRRKSSELTQRKFGSQQGQTLEERIEMLRHPGAKQTGQTHTGVTAFGTARAPTDLASDNQRTNTALGQVVVRRNKRHGHKDKQFREKSFHPLAEWMVRGRRVCKRLRDLPEALLEDVLLRHACLVLLGRGKTGIRTVFRPGDGLFVEGFDGFGPGEQLLIVRAILFEVMHVA